MIDDILIPNSAKGEILDNYLAFGWYRTGKFIFTTDFLEIPGHDRAYSVFWLRYVVKKIQLSASAKKIISRNKQFDVRYRVFSLTNELIDLHAQYVSSLEFETAKSLELLLSDVTNEVWDSYVIEVRDNGKLIAAGVFDKGVRTIEGIVNFYDPAYKKYSPGKYLMLLKLNYCYQNSIPLYYPGYYSPEYPVFDYKLFFGEDATEVFIPQLKMWVPYQEFTKLLVAIKLMH